MANSDVGPDEESRLLPGPGQSRNGASGGDDGDDSLSIRFILGIAFTWFASFLAALDGTITSTISATVAHEFGSLAIISWLASAYLIALTATQPLSGKLTDIYGRRTGFLLCAITFALGNCVCGFAQSTFVIVVGRILAGIGGGGINSISTFIGNDLIPMRKRGIVHGFGNIVFAIGVGLGGLVGGSINQSIGWRWAFILLSPLSIIAAVGVAFFLPPLAGPENGPRLQRIDFTGSLLIVTSLATFLVGLNNDTQYSAITKTTLSIAAVLFIGFVLNEIYIAKEPIIPLRLLKLRTVTAASLAVWFNSMTAYTMIFYVPIYFQLRGFGTAKTGLLIVPEAVGAGLGSLASGIIMRHTGGYAILKWFVLGIFILGSATYTVIHLDAPLVIPEISLFVHGLGFGGCLTTMMLALLSSIDHQDSAVATSIFYAFRSIGATIGVTASSTLFRAVINKGQRTQIDLNNLSLHHVPNEISGGLPTDPVQVDIYLNALHHTFALATGFALCGFVCGVLTKNNKLSNKPVKRLR